MSKISIKVLPAEDGDCFILSFNKRNILIDGGRSSRNLLRHLEMELQSIKDKTESIDLLVITHIDDDHIGGVLSIFEMNIHKELIQNVWFNSGRLIDGYFKEENNVNDERDIPLILTDTQVGIEKGNSLEKELKKSNIEPKYVINQGATAHLDGAIFRILSPNQKALAKLNENWEVEIEEETNLEINNQKNNDYAQTLQSLANQKFKQDTSNVNASSIAFLFEYNCKKVLLLGDSHPSIVKEGLERLGYSSQNKLYVDVVKISHHGSRKNTSEQLLELIECRNFIISTNGGRGVRNLPDKESLSRIVTAMSLPVTFHFNYPIYDNIFSEEELKTHKIKLNSLYESNYILEV
ncbi:MBL fold protein [Bacillus wiedmannii]|uniref:ComEC/Rec2 family competence protein n=1 Tax=Bacillus wiedmannii TaxID=1890302 RepID=UPI000BF3BE26|nr:MBL fold metallo-hydrolase [Bacillus wiedmannii]PFX61619.1 MBL fold protein [Bacillus wiedmannii]